jgi:hypothetical protein
MNTRGKLSARFVEQVAADWEKYGAEVLEKVRQESPTKYAQLVADLLPREVKVKEEVAGPFDDYKSVEDFREFFVKTVIEQGWAGDVIAAMKVVPAIEVEKANGHAENDEAVCEIF